MSLNSASELINQQYGFSIRRNSDVAIKRLRCAKEHFYTQLLPPLEEDDFYRDTPIFACKFSPQESNEHLVALANEEGKLAIHDSSNNKRYGIHAHNNAIFDLAWMFDQMKLVTASGDHTSKLYNIENGDFKEERIFCGHSRSVKTVAFRKNDSSVFASGGRDGNILLWDMRTDVSSYIGKVDRTISNSHTSKLFTPTKSKKKFGTPTMLLNRIKSVTGLVFQDGNTLISCGAGDGVIKIWDLRKNYMTYKRDAVPKNLIPYPGNTSKNGYSSLVIDNEGVKLYANCLDNTVYCYNVGTCNTEPVMQYVGHQNSTFYIKSSLCRNGTYLISGSSDENAYIWNTKNSHPLVKLTGHTAEVTCVAWSSKSNVLITCSDDMTHKIWTVGPEELASDSPSRGSAEVLPRVQEPAKIHLKRPFQLGNVYECTPKKFFTECERCSGATNCTRFCENCNVTSSKRKGSCELVNENKRVQTELGPRRLFSNINHNVVVNKDAEPLAKPLDPSDEKEVEEYEHPTKKLQCSPPRRNILSSPTVNLPNYIVDGIAPHLHYSPPKKKNQDWLTKIRIEKNLRKEMHDRTVGPSMPKIPKLDIPAKNARPSSPKSPLLRFFKVTNKCDGLTCSKSHGNSNLQQRQ